MAAEHQQDADTSATTGVCTNCEEPQQEDELLCCSHCTRFSFTCADCMSDHLLRHCPAWVLPCAQCNNVQPHVPYAVTSNNCWVCPTCVMPKRCSGCARWCNAVQADCLCKRPSLAFCRECAHAGISKHPEYLHRVRCHVECTVCGAHLERTRDAQGILSSATACEDCHPADTDADCDHPLSLDTNPKRKSPGPVAVWPTVKRVCTPSPEAEDDEE